ncbi:MAG: HEAT repeat domain-containing protein, partial [Microcoleaceae cyanobacterium]
MSITPESVQELLSSEDFGDRLRAVNQFRQLEEPIAFELAQRAMGDKNARVRYTAVCQMATLG